MAMICQRRCRNLAFPVFSQATVGVYARPDGRKRSKQTKCRVSSYAPHMRKPYLIVRSLI